MKQITSGWLFDPGAQSIFRLLKEAGYVVYFVGGCVRNELLGTPISDLDLATNAHPDAVMTLAKGVGIKTIPTGIEHGTVTLISHGQSFEITTFRKDVETDGRRAVVTFSESIREDALRRDFTMNALYADPAGKIIDPLNGVSDLNAGLVRFIENPNSRIQEDYLRILRFFRFNAWYGRPENGMDADALAAISANISGLDTLSGERIGREVMKMLAAVNPAFAVATMYQTGVLTRILPGASCEHLPFLVHLEEQCQIQPSALRRLTSLGLGLGTKDRLRLSNKEAKQLSSLENEIGNTSSAAELAYRYTYQFGLDVILLRCAFFEKPLPATLRNDLRQGAQACFPIGSSDLLEHYQGAALGEKIRKLEARWIASGFKMTREELMA